MLIALFLLSGCVHSTPQVIKIEAPADLAAPCKKLPMFNGKDMEYVVRYTKDLMTMYKVCSAKQKALAEIQH